MAITRERIQRSERRAGLLRMAAAAAGLAAANSPAADAYHALLHAELGPLPVHRWISDALMACFFLLVGLEVKREWLEGRLATREQRRLPLIAAAGGMAVPALLYLLVAGIEPAVARGWAIPSATDIAFAVGVLALLGPRAPPSIKLLLVTLAIVDDIGAVAIIAIGYSHELNPGALAATLLLLSLLGLLNQLGVRRLWPYLAGFALLWITVEQSGVHATIAGVLAALAIPAGGAVAGSPLRRLEHRLHPWVMFGIMPLFGFANAGVALDGGWELLASPIGIAVAAGLFVGKQAGVFGAIWLAVRWRIAARPSGASWAQIYGAALLCGIGFTMSLFIAALAFPEDPQAFAAAKLGILVGSLLSALAGALVIRQAGTPTPPSAADSAESEAIFAGTDRALAAAARSR